jgi:hypothetical protein
MSEPVKKPIVLKTVKEYDREAVGKVMAEGCKAALERDFDGAAVLLIEGDGYEMYWAGHSTNLGARLVHAGLRRMGFVSDSDG